MTEAESGLPSLCYYCYYYFVFYKGIKNFFHYTWHCWSAVHINVNKVLASLLCVGLIIVMVTVQLSSLNSHHLALVQILPPLGPTSPGIFSWSKGAQPLHCHRGHLE